MDSITSEPLAGPTTEDKGPPPGRLGDYQRMALLVGLGWFGTNVALSVMDLPLSFVLKEQLGLQPDKAALFLALATFSNYVKPIFGLLTDSVPLFGTRRRSYLLLGLLLSGLGYLVLPLAPRSFWPFLIAYATLYVAVVLVSTVMGGVMVEVGHRFSATGRLSAQRVGIVRAIPIFAGPLGGWLSTFAFFWATGMAGVCHLLLLPLIYFYLREPRGSSLNTRVWQEAREQLRRVFTNGTLWASVGLIVLVIAAPGFDTPLLYYQIDDLHFSKPFIGQLKMVAAIGAFMGAALYAAVCRRYTLRTLLAWSIVVHAGATLVYLAYKTPTSALWITWFEGLTGILAVLPLYDLCIRVTTRGGEGLGYSLMMSCWNITASASNVGGSWLYTQFKFHFFDLVWVNAGTTILVLFLVPFLPRVLMDRKEGTAL
jgi:Na+/melibiose symporter-like transporter